MSEARTRQVGKDRQDGQDDDLPNIGNPARGALATIGITRLDHVAARSERELLALHGFGPKALRILREALETRGWRFGEVPGVGDGGQPGQPAEIE